MDVFNLVFMVVVGFSLLHTVDSLNRNPVNWNFRKWVGCEALASIQDNGSL